MCEGKSFHIHAPSAGKARHPTVETDGRNRQTVVGRGLKSLSRRNVSDARGYYG